MTSPHEVVLSLGSNLGDREATLRAAVRDIAALDDVVIDGSSGLVETPAHKPHGVDRDAPPYLNAIVALSTTLDPHELLRQLGGIELAHGRVREEVWGDRTLDIDIVTIDELVIDTEDLVLPHPRAFSRAFVLEPWLDIDPDATLPGLGRVDALLAATGDAVTRHPAEPLA